jgi:hypothetical protein
MKEKIYMKVTDDELELPLIVTSSLDELARLTHRSKSSLVSSICHGSKQWKRVDIEEEDLEE